ncbi:MAG: YlxR family protein [Myxococcales bacterium]|nr:YlxR family protein [Myxococcales bacterium]
MSTERERAGAGPERTCIGCGKKRPKRSLRRLVLDEQGQLAVDQPQTAPGRGAYLCGEGCLTAAAKRKAFQRAFRGAVKSLELKHLEAALQRTP